jgi:hypothetical protein
MLEKLPHVQEPAAGLRLDLAVEQLATGLGFVFEDVWSRKDGEKLQIEAVAPGSSRIVSETEASELMRITESALERVKAVDAKFAALITRLQPQYCVIDDNGMGKRDIPDGVRSLRRRGWTRGA